MSASSWFAFTVVVALTYAAPGPDFAIILRYATHGRRWGRLAACGVLLGMCVHLTAATAGLSAVLLHSATAFTIIKIIGAGYLLVLGLQSLLGRHQSDPDDAAGITSDEHEPTTGRHAFTRGVLTNLLNPKTALFFIALIPQFLHTNTPAPTHTLLLGLATITFGGVWWMTFIALVDRLHGVLNRPGVRRGLDRLTGIAFIALSIRLLRTPAAGWT